MHSGTAVVFRIMIHVEKPVLYWIMVRLGMWVLTFPHAHGPRGRVALRVVQSAEAGSPQKVVEGVKGNVGRVFGEEVLR